MGRALFLSILATGVISSSACNRVEPRAPAAPSAPATAAAPARMEHIPGTVRAIVLTARPGLAVSGAELKQRDGRRYYDVAGRMPDGDVIELDLLETPSGWKVVEIQRDLPWSRTPERVRVAVERVRADFIPVRVVESIQAGDGSIVYDLFADGQPATPALEVRVDKGQTEILKEDWLH